MCSLTITDGPWYKLPVVWTMLLVFAVGIAVYLATLAPVVTGEDSGELATAAYCLGVPHPSGFPLWCMLAKCFTWLPFGTVAARTAFFSAVCGALTGSLVCLFVYRLGHSWFSGFLTGSICLFGKCFWSHAAVVEVYLLNGLFIIIALLILQSWQRNHHDRLLMWLAFLFGLGMSNHLMLFFLLIVVGMFLVLSAPAMIKRIGFLCRLIFLFGIGLTPYMYLPIRARAHPAINWGQAATWQAFWAHVSRHQYAKVESGEKFTIASFAFFWRGFFEELVNQYGALILFIALLGMLFLAFRNRRMFLVIATFAAISVVGPILAVRYSCTEQNLFKLQAWYYPVYIMVAIGVGGACSWLLERRTLARQEWLKRVVAACLLGMPIYAVYRNYHICDKSDNYLAHDHALNILDCLPRDAVYFSGSDHSCFPVLYLQAVEDTRNDVVIADYSGALSERLLTLLVQSASKQDDEGLLAIIDEYRNLPNLPIAQQDTAPRAKWRRQIISCIPRLLGRDVYYHSKSQAILPTPDSRLVPHGLLFKVGIGQQEIDSHRSISAALWTTLEKRYVKSRNVYPDYTNKLIMFDWHMARLFHALGINDTQTAKAHLEKCKEYAGRHETRYNNLGSCLAEYGLLHQAYEAFGKAVSLRSDYDMALKNLALVCYQLKKYDLRQSIRCIHETTS